MFYFYCCGSAKHTNARRSKQPYGEDLLVCEKCDMSLCSLLVQPEQASAGILGREMPSIQTLKKKKKNASNKQTKTK